MSSSTSAVLLPLLAVVSQVFFESPDTFALRVLSIAGIAGAIVVFWLYKRLQADVDELNEAFTPHAPS